MLLIIKSQMALHRFQGYTMTNLEPYAGEFSGFITRSYSFGRERNSVLSILPWAGKHDQSGCFISSCRSGKVTAGIIGVMKMRLLLPVREIEIQSANTHLIPASKAIVQQLAQIDQDDLIYLKGQLVEVKSSDRWTWRSSLSREDTGNGACELMLVEEVQCCLSFIILELMRKITLDAQHKAVSNQSHLFWCAV